jgi:hypothetical protein
MDFKVFLKSRKFKLICWMIFVSISIGGAAIAGKSNTNISDKPNYESGGLVFAINRVVVDKHGNLTVQYVVQNTTNVRKYIILYGSNLVALNNGQFLNIDNSNIMGIGHCRFLGKDSQSLKECLEEQSYSNPNGGGKNIENFTKIEPGRIAQASIRYMGSMSKSGNATEASFTFMALVCSKQQNIDPLLDTKNNNSFTPLETVNYDFVNIPIIRK